MEELFSLDGQIAMVTGAASGLGLAISEVLSQAGAHVVLTDIDEAGLEKAGESMDGTVETMVLDAGKRDDIRAAMDAIVGRHGRIDIVVANAGISAGPGYKTETGQINAVEDERWDQVLDVNLTGIFATIQSAAKHMKQQRSGRIIVISSIGGLRSEVMVGYAYAATKAAVINLVRQSAMELAPYNVMVNGIAPGPFRTNIANGRIKNPEIEAQFAALVPLGRIAEPDEIKGLALLLAGPSASYITGSTIAIDGGVMAS